MECGDAPLYRTLATAVAGDADLLEVAALARHRPAPNLLLAAVHDLLLRGQGADLAAFYPTLTTTPLPARDAVADFREFVLSSRADLAPLLRERLVQTNEVRRASVLYLALSWLASEFGLQRIGLIEVGASAGLLLAVDQYRYRFGDMEVAGPARASLEIATGLRGPLSVESPTLPEIVGRIGIDLHTVNLDDATDRRWLRALVWGDQPGRMEMLDRAIAVARRIPMRMLQGDGNSLLPATLAALPKGLPAIVYHSHALNQFSPDARERFAEVLAEASNNRDVYRIAMEGRENGPAVVKVTAYRRGAATASQHLADYDAHGAWIEWPA